MALTSEEAQARVAALRKGDTSPTTKTSTYRHLHFLPEQAEQLLEALDTPDGINLGLPQIDVLTRGFRAKDLVIVTGFAHSGKTQLVNTMLRNNAEKRVLFFSLDDPAEMILAKLVAMIEGTPAEELEQRVRRGDEEAKALVRHVAKNVLTGLIVVDTSMGIPTMQEAIAEACEHWGETPQAVVLDFLELVPGNGRSDDEASNVKAKSRAMKAWANQLDWPTIVLHQGTRSNSKPGAPITLVSAAFGGEQEATILLGVRRKRDNLELDTIERDSHLNTVTVHVVKNKRPGGKLTHYQGIDFALDAPTGIIRPLDAADVRGSGPVRVSNAADAAAVVKRAMPIFEREPETDKRMDLI